MTRGGERSLKYPGIFRQAYAGRDRQGEAEVAFRPGGELGGGHEEEPVEAAEGVEAGELEAAGGGGIVAEGEEGFEVVEVEAAQVAPDLFEPGAQNTALEGEGELGEAGASEDAAAGGGMGEAGEGGGGEGTKPIFFLGDDGGQAGEGSIDFGVELLTDLREEMVAEPVAAVMGLLVRGVFPPGDLAGLEPVAEGGAGHREERAEDLALRVIENAGETAGTGTTEQAEENGFGLVFEGVAGENGVDGAGGEPLVAEIAQGFFAGVRGLHAFDEQGASQGVGEEANVAFIGIAFDAAQAVVHVQQGDGQTGFGTEAGEGDRVTAATDGHAEAGVGTQAGEPGGGKQAHG